MYHKVNEHFVKYDDARMPFDTSFPVKTAKRKRILVDFADGRTVALPAILFLWRVSEAERLIKNGSGDVGRYTAG